MKATQRSPFTLETTPRIDGKLEASIQGLLDETQYYLVVFAIDDEGNRGSSPSNATAWTQMVFPTVEEPALSKTSTDEVSLSPTLHLVTMN